MNFLNNISKKQILMLIAALIIVAAIPLTVFISQKQQEIRQRAAETPPISFYFTKTNDPLIKLNSLSISPKATAVLNLYMVNGINNVNGFDITIGGDSNLNITILSPGADASKFNEAIVGPSVDLGNNNARFSKVNSNTGGTPINGTILLASITVTAMDNVTPGTTGNITISNANLTSPSDTSKYVPVNSSSLILPYTISALPPTPTPTTISYRSGDVAPAATAPTSSGLVTLSFNVALSGMSPAMTTVPITVTLYSGSSPIGPFTNISLVRQANTNIFTGNSQTSIRASDIPGFQSGQKYYVEIKAQSYQKKLAIGGEVAGDTPGLRALLRDPKENRIPAVTLLPGDINNDGGIDGADLGILIACFGSKNILTASTGVTDCGRKTQSGLFNADINKDGKVDGADINLWARGENGTL